MRLAIVSDLHVQEHITGAPLDSWLTTASDRSPATNNPVVSLLRLIANEGLRPDCLICPGDLTNKASIAGLWASLAYLTEIVDAMGGCKLILTPGNHDVVTATGGGSYESLKDLIRNRLPINELATSKQFKSEHFALVEVANSSIIVLDTTAKATDRNSARRGVFDEDLRDRLREFLAGASLKQHRIAVLHHHPMLHSAPGVTDADVLDRGDELLAILADFEFSLVVHGHKHQARIGYGARNDSPAVLASGSLAWIPQGTLATQTRNLFHIVELESTVAANCAFSGTVRTWQFVHGTGWQPASWSSTMFPHKSGFGCRLPTKDLAALVAAASTSGSATWKSVAAAIPQLNFVAPSDLERMFQKLESDHGIDVSFDRAGDPQYITSK